MACLSKVLNPGNGYAAALQNTSNVPVTNDWQRFYVDAEILPEYIGWPLQIGFVNQEPFMFDGSLENNIKYSNLQATEKKLKKAIK